MIAKKDYGRFGFDERLTFEQAKEHCRHLNSKANLKKRNEKAHAKRVAQDNHDELIESAFLPKAMVINFKEKVLIKRFADGEKEARYQKLLVHWNFVQKMIADLKIEPKDYAEECSQFYRYFQKSRISASYVKKVLRILNAWGIFYAREATGYSIEPVKQPLGKKREAIVDSNYEKGEYVGPSDALTFQYLETVNAKGILIPENYNWLYLTVWLGLRPTEVDSLKSKNTRCFNVETQILNGVATKVISIYQPKLLNVAADKRWKRIPLFLPEQKKCLKIIDEKCFRRPLNKSLRAAFPDARITCYSGRKGFVDLMMDHEQQILDISMWLGHQSIETTMKYYKQKQIVRFKKVA